jgi:glutathionyl-hydroquinone reductase
MLCMQRPGASLTAREIADGRFERQRSRFTAWVTADGSSGFGAEPGRYHLYVARACPWSQRTLIVRKLKGLEDVIGVSYADPYRDERGWAFSGRDDLAGRGTDAATGTIRPGQAQAGEGFTDVLHGWDFLAEAYKASDPSYEGRLTVPVLWDRETGTIVNNDSADIVRMLNSAWDEWGDASVDLCPPELRGEIDELNGWIYERLNNGVYRAGFARSQEAYDEAFDDVFAALARLEAMLAERRYLTGDRITEADWRAWVTLVRFDPVYHTHFRLNGRRVMDHRNLWGYTRELYQVPGVAETTSIAEIKVHYYTTHDELNPKHIIPKGPLDWDLSAPHGRG